MNFLAHLHLAYLAESSLFGNLVADFVRGNPEGKYDIDVVAGIMMHRRVDVLTDKQSEVITSRRYFNTQLRRVAPITLDVVWDHFLARHWEKLEPACSLQHFTQQACKQITPYLHETSSHFQNLNYHLWHESWLERYAELPFISYVLQGMARRRPRLAALALTFSEVERHYHQLEIQFWQFYPGLMLRAKMKLI